MNLFRRKPAPAPVPDRRFEEADCLLDLPLWGEALPLRRATDGRLCLKLEAGAGAAPVMALTLPKAGTYLIAEVLKGLGLVDAEAHVALDGFTDYRTMSVDQKIAEGRSRGVQAPMELTAGLIRPGQFAVGHIVHEWRSAQALRPFGKLLMTRAWRDCLASFMRFEARRIALDPARFAPEKSAWTTLDDPQARQVGYLRAFGAEHTAVAQGMVGWLSDPSVLALRFEDLLGDGGEAAQAAAVTALAAHLGLPEPADPRGLLLERLGAKTLTWSGSRSHADDSWSDEAEALFIELGGAAVDAAFGGT